MCCRCFMLPPLRAAFCRRCADVTPRHADDEPPPPPPVSLMLMPRHTDATPTYAATLMACAMERRLLPSYFIRRLMRFSQRAATPARLLLCHDIITRQRAAPRHAFAAFSAAVMIFSLAFYAMPLCRCRYAFSRRAPRRCYGGIFRLIMPAAFAGYCCMIYFTIFAATIFDEISYFRANVIMPFSPRRCDMPLIRHAAEITTFHFIFTLH